MDLKLSVDYYNNKEKELFKSYSNFKSIEQKLGDGISISQDEFLVYMMFTEQKDFVGWKNYDELSARVQSRFGDVEDYLDFRNNSVQSKFPSTVMHAAGFTERIGVSLGLNVVNKLNGLTEADWTITPDQYHGGKRVKDFDYTVPIAASPNNYIQVENKGSITDDVNLKKSSSVSQHFSSIKSKKESIFEREAVAKTFDPKNIYYGTIGVIDRDNQAKVWLVDPPAFEMEWPPIKFKLITRLSFYHNLFKIIGVRPRIITALDERIKELVEVDDVYKFDRKPLSNVKVNQRSYLSAKHIVKINTNEAFGRFFIINVKQEDRLYVVALHKLIITLIIRQDLNGILGYDYKNDELNDKVSIEFNDKSKDSNLELLNKLGFLLDKRRKQFSVQFNKELRSTSSGRIFGLV